MYYIFLENEKLNGCGQCKRLDCENIETTQEIYEDYIKTPNKYTWEEKEIEVEIPDFETIIKTIDIEVSYYETVDKEIEVEVPIYETIIEKVQVQIGEDEEGNPIYEQQEVENQVQIGTETKTEIIQEQVEKTRIEQKEVEETIQIRSHTENKTIKVIVLNPGYEKEEEEKRKQNFESQFLQTSLGNYRLQPKGYANAQQSIDTINNIVNAFGGLNEQVASMVIFYPTPDFTKEEECTEEWLIAHQYNPQPMSKEDWIKFYIEFTTVYAQKQYMLGLN